ncbi:hypothetical protein SOVF_213400, partial [Spinacia oleracea]
VEISNLIALSRGANANVFSRSDIADWTSPDLAYA